MPVIFLRLCHCLNQCVVRPNAFEPRSARIQQCVKPCQDGDRVSATLPTGCQQVLDLLRLPPVLQDSLLDGSVSVHFVGILDEVFVRPRRFAKSRTPAFLKLPPRPARHFPRDLVHSLDHFSSCTSFWSGRACNHRSCLCTCSATCRRTDRCRLFTARLANR